jgi:hypothetical protein
MESPANVAHGPWKPRTPRRRYTPEEKARVASEALQRIQSSQSLANFAAVIDAFTERGIPEDQIQPKENCLTYNAWQAKGRQVRRGEHGAKITVYYPTQLPPDAPPDAEPQLRPVTAVIFHISQTDPKGA